MPKHRPYAPVPMPPDDLSPTLDPGNLPVTGKKRQKELNDIVDKTHLDLARQEGLRIKQGHASYAEQSMTTTAITNIDKSITHLAQVREEPERDEWATKRIHRATDHLADDTERRQRGIAEAVSREITNVARKPIEPDEVAEPTFLDKLTGNT